MGPDKLTKGKRLTKRKGNIQRVIRLEIHQEPSYRFI